MHDYKYESCINYSVDWTSVVRSTRTPEFLPLARTFSANIGRVGAMAQLPAEMNYWSMMIGMCKGAAMERLGEFGVGEHSTAAKELGNQLFQQWAARRARHDPALATKEAWNVGTDNFKILAAEDGTGILYEGMQATLSTMITTAWAAFETLAIDLWIATVNKHPHPLATRAMDRSPEKTVAFHLLSKHKFDLSNNMGQIIFDSGKIGFQKFDQIKVAYELIFSKDWTKIFDGKQNLTTAEIIRHLYAHRTGFVDQTFLSRARNLPLLTGAKINKQLEIDGNLVASCVDACVTTAVELLSFVDRWSCSMIAAESPSGA